MAIVDFTNPEACKWYVGLIHTLMDTGVDTIKTDFGERIPHLDVVYHDGSDPRQVAHFLDLYPANPVGRCTSTHVHLSITTKTDIQLLRAHLQQGRV
jgi:hypothetical protein